MNRNFLVTGGAQGIGLAYCRFPLIFFTIVVIFFTIINISIWLINILTIELKALTLPIAGSPHSSSSSLSSLSFSMSASLSLQWTYIGLAYCRFTFIFFTIVVIFFIIIISTFLQDNSHRRWQCLLHRHQRRAGSHQKIIPPQNCLSPFQRRW